jgi:hypothetical protein
VDVQLPPLEVESLPNVVSHPPEVVQSPNVVEEKPPYVVVVKPPNVEPQ